MQKKKTKTTKVSIIFRAKHNKPYWAQAGQQTGRYGAFHELAHVEAPFDSFGCLSPPAHDAHLGLRDVVVVGGLPLAEEDTVPHE